MMMVGGAVMMATGDRWILKEYIMAIGIVLLMAGIYQSTRVWPVTSQDPNQGRDEPY